MHYVPDMIKLYVIWRMEMLRFNTPAEIERHFVIKFHESIMNHFNKVYVLKFKTINVYTRAKVFGFYESWVF
jgi:hypothetical protein